MIKKAILAALILVSVFCGDSFASHIVGGEFTYQYYGDTLVAGSLLRKYRITLFIYEDCVTGDPGAIADDDPANFTVFDNDGAPFTNPNSYAYDSIFYSRAPGSGGSIDVPANFSNDCIDRVPQLCLLRKKFEANIALPPNVKGYTVAYQRCCRNASIVNVVDPDSKGATYYCEIPGNLRNSSAVFKNYPPQIICLNNPMAYDHSATDADGDSLSYEFCGALEGATADQIKPKIASAPPYNGTVQYYPPYTATAPMPGFPPVEVDPTTGMVSGTPNKIGRYLVTVCCHEWRDGIMINTIRREFQFVVTDCSKKVIADIPQLSNELNTYIVDCKDKTVKFINKSSGGFAYTWTFGVAGAGSGDFEPEYTYPDTGTYSVKLVVNPGSTCPDSISKLVKIYPSFRTAFDDSGAYCPGQPLKFSDLTSSTFKPIRDWSWAFGDGATSTEQNPIHTYSLAGTYNVVMASGNEKGCADTSLQKLVIQDFRPFAGDDTIIVKGEYIRFDASGGVTYRWYPQLNLDDTTISNPSANYPDTGTYVYRVRITSAFGCVGHDTMRVLVVPDAYYTVPTAFTPNNDGKNDIFRPKAAGYRQMKYFRIFNRFGEEVYYGETLESGWDGTYKGRPAEIGVYFWEMLYIDRFGKEGFKAGDVTLLR